MLLCTVTDITESAEQSKQTIPHHETCLLFPTFVPAHFLLVTHPDDDDDDGVFKATDSREIHGYCYTKSKVTQSHLKSAQKQIQFFRG